MDIHPWRQRAERLRQVASECNDTMMRQTLLVLADDCERLASQSERPARTAGDEN